MGVSKEEAMSHTIRTRPLGIIGLVAALAAVVALQGSQAQDSKPVSEVLTPEKERTLQPKAIFKECPKCPEMVVVPAGEFLMGSPANENDRSGSEDPRHKVSIATAFAVGRFEVTLDEWDACNTQGGCERRAWDLGWGRDRRPALAISWDDAQQYVAWLSKLTGKRYRLLAEAEWEYAARAGSDTAYPWGNEIGKGNANCIGCGSPWEKANPGATLGEAATAPVGSFAPNAFGLYDMHGNVYEWVEDCYHWGYSGTPADGSAWTAGDADQCRRRVFRGGSYSSEPDTLRSAYRSVLNRDAWNGILGFRVARTLAR
jgi:formylglycine-generating enzyme required for sulfatase activity